MNRILPYIALLGALMLVCGCSQVDRHKVLTTIFEGVPSLPPPEQLCKEYAEKRLVAFQDELAGKKDGAADAASKLGSVHRPYDEKRCDDCHDKSKEGGTVLPKNELCGMCHTGFLKGMYAHGPAAVGDCLACHVPHTSNFPKLLKVDKAHVCSTCHKEQRLAQEMHDKIAARKMVCTDCHDPHSGNSSYFLK